MSMIKKPKVLLVGWDAADWEHIQPLLEKGQLPTLQRLIDSGVTGNLGTLNPMLSPMLWNSVATGKQPYKHGIHGFIEPDPVHGGSRPFSSVSRKTKALWNMLSQSGYTSNVINWWASHPAEKIRGCVVSNAFGGTKPDEHGILKVPTGTVHPEHLAQTLAELKVYQEELTGEQILPFVPRGMEIDQNNDNRLAMLAQNLAEMLTTHMVATKVMETQPWDFMAVYYTAIDHFSHAFMMYHPPRLPWVNERDFELYKDVVTGVYRFSDMTLHRLLQLAGPDTIVIVCSDHGFQSRELRPPLMPNEPAGPAYWHRRFGVFLASGPGIKKQQRVLGATLLDIAPTILSMFDLPIGQDMDGRPLLEIFEKPNAPKYVESWDTLAGESGMHSGEVTTSAAEQEDLLNQFVALGYIEAPGANKEEQAELADIEAKYNIGRNLAWCGKTDEAMAIFTELVRRSPWESRFITQLAQVLRQAGHVRTAESLLARAFDLKHTRHAGVRLLHIDTLIMQGRSDEAMAAMRELEAIGPGHPDIWNAIGNHYLRLRAWDDAERAFLGCLRVHPENAEAHTHLSTLYFRVGDNQKTVDTALEAIRVLYRQPRAHINLGVALLRAGERERGLEALKNAVVIDPANRAAHRWLATAYASMFNDHAKASEHRAIVRKLETIQRETAMPATWPDSITLDLPDLMTEEERDRVLNEKRPQPENPMLLSGKTFVLVSGLPRSGTSLMMQMLEAGGLPPKTDGERTADADNPKGYYEWEAIKQVRDKPEIMREPGLDRKAIKAISALLPQMPYQHEYKIIFMVRPIEEVAASQAAMIERLGTSGAKGGDEEIIGDLKTHRDLVLKWLEGHPRAKHLVVSYPDLVNNPSAEIERIASFLGVDLLPHPEKMLAAVDRSLYRKRKT